MGEYIRGRRLFLAAEDIMGGEKIIDVANKYDYDSPDSFAKAFKAFHGVLPSEVKEKKDSIVVFPRFVMPVFGKTSTGILFKIRELNELRLIGYKKFFEGSPSGTSRETQEKKFIQSTRAKQWLLRGAASNTETEFLVLTNISDRGYDFYIAYELDQYDMDDLYDPQVTGIDCIGPFGDERIYVPGGSYAIFTTAKQVKPINAYFELREKICRENLLNADYRIADKPELVQIHWRPRRGKNNRYVEICIPVEKAMNAENGESE